MLRLNKVVHEYGDELYLSNEAAEEIGRIEESFDDYSKFLYKLVKVLAGQGRYKELFLRLDFNRNYATVNNDGEQ